MSHESLKEWVSFKWPRSDAMIQARVKELENAHNEQWDALADKVEKMQTSIGDSSKTDKKPDDPSTERLSPTERRRRALLKLRTQVSDESAEELSGKMKFDLAKRQLDQRAEEYARFQNSTQMRIIRAGWENFDKAMVHFIKDNLCDLNETRPNTQLAQQAYALITAACEQDKTTHLKQVLLKLVDGASHVCIPMTAEEKLERKRLEALRQKKIEKQRRLQIKTAQDIRQNGGFRWLVTLGPLKSLYDDYVQKVGRMTTKGVEQGVANYVVSQKYIRRLKVEVEAGRIAEDVPPGEKNELLIAPYTRFSVGNYEDSQGPFTVRDMFPYPEGMEDFGDTYEDAIKLLQKCRKTCRNVGMGGQGGVPPPPPPGGPPVAPPLAPPLPKSS